MKTVKKIVTLIVFLILVCSMMGCSEAELGGEDKGPSIDVEGVYDGTVDFSSVDSGWLQLNKISYNVSLDGDRILFASNIEGNDDLEGTYDAMKNEALCFHPGEPGFKDTVVTIKFYDEDGTIKASGEMVSESIELSDILKIPMEMVKRSDE